MKARLIVAALAALVSIGYPAAASAQRGGVPGRGGELRTLGPERRDWTQTAVRTPEGGFRMGNPDAPVRVIEYLSLTCPHCAEFSRQSGERLFLQYVRTGRVSVEYRNFYLDGVDIAAALLSRCATPGEYFNMTHALLGSQREWLGRVSGLTPAQRAEFAGLQPLQIAQRLIPLLGLDTIGGRFGVTPAVRQACLNQAGLDQLEAMHNAAASQGVRGTPTFFINGQMAQTNVWSGIEPLLRGR